MRRVLMLGLLMVQGWAGANCNLLPTLTPTQQAASDALRQLPKHNLPCLTQSPMIFSVCKQYDAPVAQVLPLFQKANGATATADGKGWRLTWRVGGTQATAYLQPAQGGTRLDYRRRLSVDEKLESDLYDALQNLAQQQQKSPVAYVIPPDCASLGLRSSASYTIASCAVLPGNLLGREPAIALAISKAADRSIPLNTPRSFGYTKKCGYHFFTENL